MRTPAGHCITPTLQDIETDATELVNIWVEDLGEEADLGRCHGVVFGEEQLELEYPALPSVSFLHLKRGDHLFVLPSYGD